jgi:hypothetical protein
VRERRRPLPQRRPVASGRTPATCSMRSHAGNGWATVPSSMRPPSPIGNLAKRTTSGGAPHPDDISTTLSGKGLACNDSCRSDRGCKRCKPVMTAAPQQLSPPWLLPFGVAPRPGAFVVPYSGAFACERKGPVAR